MVHLLMYLIGKLVKHELCAEIILDYLLPHDGKRKKAVVQQTYFHAPKKRWLSLKAVVSLRFTQTNDD